MKKQSKEFKMKRKQTNKNKFSKPILPPNNNFIAEKNKRMKHTGNYNKTQMTIW